MHAGEDSVLARVAPFIKGDAMSRKLFLCGSRGIVTDR
jgi:hypothetical protein